MGLQFMKNIVRKLIRYGLAKSKEIQGCTPEEIRKIEIGLGICFPQTYKDFLLTLGHGAGRFFKGTDIFYKDLLNIQTWAKELLEEDRPSFQLSKDVFVFAIHQGYQFMYFHTKFKDDDPPVFRYIEGTLQPRKIDNHFSEFLLDSINQYITYAKYQKKT